MEFLEEIKSHSGKESNYGSEEKISFHKINGMIFCEKCGKEFNEHEVIGRCDICNSEEFLSGDIASYVASYLEMQRKGNLRNYFNKRFPKGVCKMNDNRMITWLLIKDELIESCNCSISNTVQRIVLWNRREYRKY